MSDLPMKQEDHPAHNMPPPPHENYRLDNSVVFSYGAGDEKSNRGQGPTKDNAENEVNDFGYNREGRQPK